MRTEVKNLNVSGEAVVKIALIEDFRPAVLGPGGLVEFERSSEIMELPGTTDDGVD